MHSSQAASREICVLAAVLKSCTVLHCPRVLTRVVCASFFIVPCGSATFPDDDIIDTHGSTPCADSERVTVAALCAVVAAATVEGDGDSGFVERVEIVVDPSLSW